MGLPIKVSHYTNCILFMLNIHVLGTLKYPCQEILRVVDPVRIVFKLKREISYKDLISLRN